MLFILMGSFGVGVVGVVFEFVVCGGVLLVFGNLVDCGCRELVRIGGVEGYIVYYGSLGWVDVIGNDYGW